MKAEAKAKEASDDKKEAVEKKATAAVEKKATAAAATAATAATNSDILERLISIEEQANKTTKRSQASEK